MKLKGIIIVLLLQLALQHCPAQQSNHRALLVGVANYPEASGWDTIHSDNDVELLKGVLSETFRIETLVDGQATYGNITRALTRLEKETREGDTVLIHFSCHGQQMWKSDEPDSLDEALVPYDAKRSYCDKYKGENHLRDDELADYVLNIRRKAGRNGLVVVLLDACHSGDSFRGEKLVRGVYDVFGLDTTPSIKRERKDVVCAGTEDGTAEVLFISACQSYEINSEYRASNSKWYGSLSYAFADIYNSHALTDMDLLKGIQKKLLENSNQCPEFATSDTTLATNLRKTLETARYNPDNSGGGNNRHWMPIAAASIAVVFVSFLLIIRCNGRRKRK